jgi:hypothetical protein
LKKSELSKCEILCREDYTYKLPLFECFFANLALCLVALKDQDRKIEKWEDAFYED